MLRSAGAAHRGQGDPRYTLWQAWERTGLQRRWLAAAEQGGSDAAAAERNLAAVTALFDLTEDYVARAPPARRCRACSTMSPPCTCRRPAPTTPPGPKRSRCSARTRRWAGTGSWW